MQWKRSIVAMALGVVATAATAQARDLCFQYASGGAPTIAKRFKVPSRNKCVPFNGVEMGNFYGAASGTACTTADGQILTLQYTYHAFATGGTAYAELATCRFYLPIPSGGTSSGNCRGTALPSPGSNTAFSDIASIWVCSGDVP